MRGHRTHKRIDPNDGKFWPVETLCGPFYNWYDDHWRLLPDRLPVPVASSPPIWQVTSKTTLLPNERHKRHDLVHHASFDVNEVNCRHCLQKLAAQAVARLVPRGR